MDSPVGCTLSDLLWKENADLAHAAWDTKFIKDMATGTLDPRQFGQYMVQDAAYCSASADNLEFLIGQAGNELKDFFRGRYESFKRCTKKMHCQWSLKADGADLGEAAQWYVDLEHKIAHEEDPLYYLVAMIPCLRLWPYLANKMRDAGAYTDANIYKFWVDENGSYHSAEKVECVVNLSSHLIDQQKASQIYRKCMYGEVNFLRSACEEELLPTPV